MTVNINTQARNNAGDAIVDLIDQGSLNPNGYMEIRSGTKPPSPQAAATGTLLATNAFSNPAFGNFSSGAAAANTIADDTNIDATGTAGWFRIYDRDGNAVMDGDITATGGGGDITFDNINFIARGTIIINSLIATIPQ